MQASHSTLTSASRSSIVATNYSSIKYAFKITDFFTYDTAIVETIEATTVRTF
jgi:hypothetical protein